MKHIIKKQTLAIDIPNGYDAWDVQNSFREAFYQDVLPRLEKVCDELELDDYTSLRLDSLTIDTGLIKSRELSSVWAREVESAFRDELLQLKKEKLPAREGKDISGTEQSELAAFLYFLENGVMPWWISDDFNATPEEVLDKLLTEKPAELITGILGLKNKKQVLKRLLYQFESSQLEKLLKHFDKPQISTVLKKFGSICKTDLKSIYKDLRKAFLATEITLTLDEKTIDNEPENLFELLFAQIKEHDSSLNQSYLTKIHNQLIIKEKEYKISKSVEVKRLISLALTVLNRFDSQSSEPSKLPGSETSNSQSDQTDATSTVGPDTYPEDSERKQDKSLASHSGTDQSKSKISPKAKVELNKNQSVIPNQKTPHPDKSQASPHDSPQDYKHPTANPEDQLSILDKRAWEHIERIKKLQLAESANREKESLRSTESDPLTGDKESSNNTREDYLKGDEKPFSKAPHLSANTTESQNDANHTTNPDIENGAPEGKGKLSSEQQIQSRGKDRPTQGFESGKENDTVSAMPEKDFHKQTTSETSDSQSKNKPQQDQRLTHQVGYDKTPFSVESNVPEDITANRSGRISGLTSDESTRPVSRMPDKDALAYWQEELETIDECYIQNAGLILFWPYLGHFFKDLELTEDGSFLGSHSQHRAALILQYLLDETPEFQEYKLPLNKLLCGLKISEPIKKSLYLSPQDLNKCHNLLEATVRNWSALRGTSAAGFQSSFVKRCGVLKRHDKHWLLQVEKKPFDMLMEQLPWPIGIVRLSWMKKPIYVEW